MSDQTNMMEAALRYAGRGMPVFPVQPDGKAPLGKLASNGVKDATTDEQQIRDWWRPVGTANIGFACGQVFAIDLDVKGEKDGIKTWEQIRSEQDEPVPETTVVKTPSGGVHLYFRAPEGVQVKNSVEDALGPGVDVRGHGGYVLVPPSSTDVGAYEFDEASDGIANAPFWLLSKVQKGKRSSSESTEVAEAPDEIPKGQRNDKLASLAGYLRRKGMSEGELKAMLKTINQSRCKPPLSDGEVESIAESVGRYDPADAAIKTVNGSESEAPQEYKEMARRLLAALYENPKHGAVVRASIPDAEALPAPFGAIFSEMMDLGLTKGDLDRARLDTRLSGKRAFGEVKSPSDFDATRFSGDDPRQLLEWARSLQAQHTNAGIAQDLQSLAKEIDRSDIDPGQSVAQVIEQVRQRAEGGTSGMTSFSEAAKDALTQVAEWREGVTSEYMRTWPSVDDKIEGFVNGQMAVMGGFTSGFKTASLVDLMKRVALRGQDVAVPIFSAEMSAEKLVRRAASNLSNVSQSTLRPDRDGTVTAPDSKFQEFEDALDTLSHLNIEVDEHPNPSYDRMLSHCLQVQSQADIGFVGFDYLEKMRMDAATEELRVSKIAQRLKALAKRLDVPVVVLSQYSRQRNGHEQLPQNHYLRYSGKIEQEAETILHWFYPKYFVDRGTDPGAVTKYDPADEYALYAVCGKQRDGKPQDAKLWVNEQTGRFIDRYDEEEAAALTPSEETPF